MYTVEVKLSSFNGRSVPTKAINPRDEEAKT
jgi:hypothetical protein